MSTIIAHRRSCSWLHGEVARRRPCLMSTCVAINCRRTATPTPTPMHTPMHAHKRARVYTHTRTYAILCRGLVSEWRTRPCTSCSWALCRTCLAGTWRSCVQRSSKVLQDAREGTQGVLARTVLDGGTVAAYVGDAVGLSVRRPSVGASVDGLRVGLHTHTHARIHTRTRTCTHAETDAHKHAQMRALQAPRMAGG